MVFLSRFLHQGTVLSLIKSSTTNFRCLTKSPPRAPTRRVHRFLEYQLILQRTRPGIHVHRGTLPSMFAIRDKGYRPRRATAKAIDLLLSAYLRDIFLPRKGRLLLEMFFGRTHIGRDISNFLQIPNLHG